MRFFFLKSEVHKRRDALEEEILYYIKTPPTALSNFTLQT